MTYLTNFYKLTVCCITYYLWKERNSRRFGGISNSSTTLVWSIKKVVIEKVLKWKNSYGLLERL
ncbi:hypothetical protein KFK09_020461 [Dendrobium nobile]|uniref:Uncharacterized protein n=1 Tax=Dendrobium nobile TaxID=94219 RepID=A0A8T3AMK6_DENNO|nr:hypothetical protein KFK09_020461 [Dendrobium nobile]